MLYVTALPFTESRIVLFTAQLLCYLFLVHWLLSFALKENVNLRLQRLLTKVQFSYPYDLVHVTHPLGLFLQG